MDYYTKCEHWVCGWLCRPGCLVVSSCTPALHYHHTNQVAQVLITCGFMLPHPHTISGLGRGPVCLIRTALHSQVTPQPHKEDTNPGLSPFFCVRLCVVCALPVFAGAAASAAIAMERGTFTKQEWAEVLGPDPSKLDNTVRCGAWCVGLRSRCCRPLVLAVGGAAWCLFGGL